MQYVCTPRWRILQVQFEKYHWLCPPAPDGRAGLERIHSRATRDMAMQAHEIAARLLPTLS